MSHSNTKQKDYPDIFIIGTGIMGVWHLTREAEACIKASRHVFLIDHGYGVAEYITELGPTVHNLLQEYKEGTNRLDIYRKMAATVVSKALAGGPVTLATYGHPGFFVYPTTLIKRAAEHLKLRVHVTAAVSCFDTILNDLDLDPGMNGIQMYEANGVIVEKRRLDNEVPCLLLQVDAVESAFYTSASSKTTRFTRLQEHLLKYYPSDHIVTSVRSASFPIFNAELISFPLNQLAQEYSSKRLGGTLYLPIANHTKVDDELVKQVFDPNYLKHLTHKE